MKFKNYKNPYTNDNIIYSFSDIYKMAIGEVLKRKQELLSQYRVLGIPTEKELQGSDNVVHVEAYTREDGTEVKAHYRSKPNRGGGVNHSSANLTDRVIEEKETELEKIKEEQPESNVENKSEEQTQKQTEQKTEQTPEDKDKRLYPDKVAGVKRGEPMSKEQAGGTNVNPNYESDDNGYKLNCTYCAAVYRARQMGYDLEALPVRENDSQAGKLLQKYPYYAYEKSDGSNVTRPEIYRSNNVEDCLNNIDSQVRKNEEYIMWFQPKDGTESLAHVVNVSRNEKNELEFYDSQSGKRYGKEYIENINFTKTIDNEQKYYPQYMFRIDDKVVKPEVLNKIARPSQRVPK